MRIRLEQSGGFAAIPALTSPVEVDLDRLPPSEARTWAALIGATDLATRPADPAEAPDQPPGGVPDGYQYRLSLYTDDGTHCRVLHDPVDDQAYADLIDHLTARRNPTPEE